MQIDRKQLIAVYADLKGIERAVAAARHDVLSVQLGTDFDSAVKRCGQILSEDLARYLLPNAAFVRGYEGGGDWLKRAEVENKLYQLLAYLEQVHHVGTEIMEIGSIYNSIRDEELRGRCADLLSASSNFDRVINQATQVLEDRIRKKSGAAAGLVGVTLVNQVVKSDPQASVLAITSEGNVQEGYAHILRGIVGAYRNPTHHQVLDHITREEALKVCAFIDGLLKVVDGATVRKPTP